MRPGNWRMMGLFLLIVLCSGSWAADGKWRLGREPRCYTLENDLTVVWQGDAASANTVVQLLIRGGGRDDPSGCSGLAYLTSRLVLEIPDQTKLQQLMDDGSSYSLQVTGDYSLITIRCLSRYLESTLAIMASVLIQPLFSDLRVDGIKELMRHRQKMEIDDPTELMQATLARVFFGASGYGAARFGDEASLAEISKKDIQAFFRSHFVAGNMVAVVISDGDEAVIKPLLARQLGRLPAGQKPSPQPVAVRKEERPALAVKRQSSQTHVSCSTLLPGLTVENYLLATLLETWLGKGIGCRLWPLRSHSDLTYGLNADVLPYQEAMLLSVYLKTGQRRASEAQSELNKLLKAVYDNGISADEIAATRAFARAIFWRENETREQRAATLAFMEGMGLSYRLAGDFAERLETIDRDQLNRFIRAWLAPESWLSLQIGPE